MKGLRFAALGAALAFGAATAIAQPPADGSQRPAAGQHRGGMRGMRGGAAGGALFRGVTLTDAQKAQVKTIRQKYAEQRRSLMGQYRPRDTSGATQGQRVRPDSATRAQMQTQVRDLMQREIAETRGILTTEQQQTFDRNVATMRERGEARGGKGRRGGAQRGALKPAR
jgi:Spy/CpxP family protein refolding chaperone